jgi:DNA-binding transcriptional ArsR family regulator
MSRKTSSENGISDRALERIAAEFKALSDPTRLRILNELRTGEKTVTEIYCATSATQSNASKQLTLLHEAGFLTRRKVGTKVFYAICDPTVQQLCDLMCAKHKERFENDSV